MAKIRAVVATLTCLSVLVSESVWAVGSDKAMYVGGTLPGLPVKVEGRADITNPTDLVFLAETGAKVTIPWSSIQELEYGQRVSRRWKTAIFLTVFALFSRGRKHFVTITYKDSSGADQAALFEFGKNVIRPTLAALKAKSGKPVACQDEEAVKQMGGTCDTVLPPEREEKDPGTVAAAPASSSTPATQRAAALLPAASAAQGSTAETEASPAPRAPEQGSPTARVRVVSDPTGADVFLGNLRVGTTTAEGLLIEIEPGTVKLSVRKAGFVTVERSLDVTSADSLTLPIVLKPDSQR